jgi:hypothetical protein
MLKDLGLALRVLAKRKAFTWPAVLTMAIGIGGTTVMFTIVDALLIRPLPFPAAGRLVWGWGRFPQSDSASVSPPDFLDYRSRARSVSLAAMTSFSARATLSGTGEPEVIAAATVSSGFFETLGVAPALGRTFAAVDDKRTGPWSPLSATVRSGSSPMQVRHRRGNI